MSGHVCIAVYMRDPIALAYGIFGSLACALIPSSLIFLDKGVNTGFMSAILKHMSILSIYVCPVTLTQPG